MFIPCLYLLPGLTQFPWTLSPPKVSVMQILRRFAVHPPGHRPAAIAALEVEPLFTLRRRLGGKGVVADGENRLGMGL